MARPGGNPNRPPLPNGPGHGRTKGSKNSLTRERVELELRRLATIDPLTLFERYRDPKTGVRRRFFTLREIADMDEDTRRCIKSVKVRTENLSAGDNAQDETVEVTLWDKTKALELCARSLGMLKDHVVVEDLSTRKDRLRVALSRVSAKADE